ncbi:MAG TPA: hypothetical protein VI454_14740 [Verrucomicrobiae bacterium]|jgi:hypothetical protein
MAIVLEANYSKKIGLPGYSSHQYLLTVRTELSDLGQVEAESRRLYGLLQSAVDNELQQAGWLPNGNGHHGSDRHKPKDELWQCSPKQKDLILKIVEENKIDKNDVEKLAADRFGKGVKLLNKLEASGLIEELFEKYPRQNRNGRQNTPQPAR